MPFSYLFRNIGKHLVDSLTYAYGIPYILAVLCTIQIVTHGYDIVWRTFVTVTHPTISQIGFIAVGLGFFLPVLLPLFAYFYGKAARKKHVQAAALATGQAGLLGAFISMLLKVFTGRLPPLSVTDVLYGTHAGFQLGFFRGGVFNGWPSTHTTIAIAMSVAFLYVYPKSPILKTLAILYALFIAVGVSTNIHWLSDAVAGICIGISIGQATGRGFLKMTQ